MRIVLNMHSVMPIITTVFLSAVIQTVFAQTQQGFVKTIGRPNMPGVPLKDVTVQMLGMVNPVISSETGEFHLSVYNKKDGDAIKLLRVQKNGYELKDKDVIGRTLVFSSHVPIYITMVDTRQLEADKKRIEDNARRVAEKNYQKQKAVIEEENSNHRLTAEKYRQELEALQSKYENYLSLIGDMADRYARTDYDKLDSIDVEINICIENGELEKADSLIHTVFDPNTVLERNRAAKKEIEDRIRTAQTMIDKARLERKAILSDMDYFRQIAALSESLARGYISQEEFQKAIDNLEKSLTVLIIIDGDSCEKVKELTELISTLRQ